MGVQKNSSSVIEVKNSQGETLKKWKDDGKQVLDSQSAYIVNDILSDRTTGLHGWMGVNGVRTSAKTGTSDKGSQPKDLWIVNYSPALVMGIWLGNSDTSVIGTSASKKASGSLDNGTNVLTASRMLMASFTHHGGTRNKANLQRKLHSTKSLRRKPPVVLQMALKKKLR